MATRAANIQPRPYKDFLTPTLHRRFTAAAVASLLLCYVEAVWMGQWTSLLWSWFPLGLAGIRTLLLFVSCLSVFMLRVSHLHVGSRTSISPVRTGWQLFASGAVIRALVFYLASAALFSEIYIISQPKDKNLGWVDYGRQHERPRVNERAVVLRFLFWTLGTVQAVSHLVRDLDKLSLPAPVSDNPNQQVQEQSAWVKLQKSLWNTGIRSLTAATSVTVFGLIFYFSAARHSLWYVSYETVKVFTTLPRASKPAHLTGLGRLIGSFVIEGTLLVFLWEVSNTAFSVQMAQAPIKRNQPLTDGSKDPNGSLLMGLKSKKSLQKSIALWELSLITEKFEDRRKAIYHDLDRVPAPAWQQLLSICMSEVQGVTRRIQDYQGPPPTDTQQQPQVNIKSGALPAQRNPNIYQPVPASPSSLAGRIANFAYSEVRPGLVSDGGSLLPPASRKLLEDGTKKVAENQKSAFRQGLYSVLRSPVGAVFRQTPARRINAVVAGSPHSSLASMLFSINALTQLVVHSVKEDQYGGVQKDVGLIIRTFMKTITDIDVFVKGLPRHWTEVEERNANSMETDEVKMLKTALKSGLRRLLDGFAEYSEHIGLSPKEIREAKEMAGAKR